MSRHGLRGVLDDISESDTGFQFGIGRIGTHHEVTCTRGTGAVRVRTSRAPLMGTVLRMHKQAGIQTKYWVHNVWGWLVALTSAGLILLGFT
jgi:hypothetical protein